MDAQDLKERIINDDKIEDVLEALGMHSINSNHKKYITCGMPDGSRGNSTTIYKDNLDVEAYTRDIKDAYGNKDIIALAMFIKEFYFSQALKWICDVCGYNYYDQDNVTPALTKWINTMWKVTQEGEKDNEELEIVDESILSYFKRYGNTLFYEDGITYETQKEFELGYDFLYHMITIPIRDELGSLVGIKGRLNKTEVGDDESKYFYIHHCAKSKILYGLHKTLPYIKQRNEVIVVESEKAVMQLWSRGIKNAVAISGHMLSNAQVKKLTHLGVPIVIAYDEGAEIGKDGKVDKNYYRNEFDKFLEQQEVYCIYDKTKKLLKEKESPSDNHEKWIELYRNHKMKVRG